jgi:hypothetical protein
MFEKTIVRVEMNAQGVLHRRGFLRSVALGAAGLTAVSFTDLLALQADELRKRQMACILLWMGGGPSQMETFDPKPGHANGGGLKPIDTAVSGIQIAPGWNKTAQVMKDVAIVRSMTNKEGNHERATYQLHTGYSPSGTVKHPNIGCVVANELGDPKFDLPHIVSINGGTTGAGMLGVSLEPFVVQDPGKPPANAVPPINSNRFSRRLGLLYKLDHSAFERFGGADRVKDHTSLYRQTAGMVLSPRMKAFDLDDAVRPGLPARPTTRSGGGDLHRGPLERLGHPSAERRARRQERGFGRPRLRRPDQRPEESRFARPDTRRLDGRVRPDAQDQPQRRP